jgi:hypothetical protein
MLAQPVHSVLFTSIVRWALMNLLDAMREAVLPVQVCTSAPPARILSGTIRPPTPVTQKLMTTGRSTRFLHKKTAATTTNPRPPLVPTPPMLIVDRLTVNTTSNLQRPTPRAPLVSTVWTLARAPRTPKSPALQVLTPTLALVIRPLLLPARFVKLVTTAQAEVMPRLPAQLVMCALKELSSRRSFPAPFTR